MAIRIDNVRNAVVDRGSDAARSIADAIPGDVKDLAKSLGSDKPIFGTPGNDYLVGSNSSDVILADPPVQDDGGGDDVVDGGEGNHVSQTAGPATTTCRAAADRTSCSAVSTRICSAAAKATTGWTGATATTGSSAATTTCSSTARVPTGSRTAPATTPSSSWRMPPRTWC